MGGKSLGNRPLQKRTQTNTNTTNNNTTTTNFAHL
jgi:hypothetical protein